MENPWIPAICIKCKKGLTDKEKDIGLPLCQNCISSLTDTIMGKMMVSEKKNVEQEIDNFSRFISSSGNLFKLDDITIIQCSFNIFMRKVSELEDKNLAISEKIFTDAIKFMEKELENIKNKNVGPRNVSPRDRLLSIFNGVVRSCGESNNGDESQMEDTEDSHDEDNNIEDVVDKKGENKDSTKDKGEYKKGENKDSKSSGKRIKVD